MAPLTIAANGMETHGFALKSPVSLLTTEG